MAYWIDNNQPYVSGEQLQFFADTDADIANLPTATSTGVEQGDSVSVIYNSNYERKKVFVKKKLSRKSNFF